MASLTIGNLGEVFYIDETSEITWDNHGIPKQHGTPQLDQLTKHFYYYHLMTGIVLLANSKARLPRQGILRPTTH